MGKKVSGIKRHIGVDTQGFSHAIAVMIADRQGALQGRRLRQQHATQTLALVPIFAS